MMVDRLTFGFLNVSKPAKATSRAIVDQIERRLPGVKIGHAGTLDPMATGVLVIAVGHATKLIERIHQFPKTYRAQFRLACTSDTDDIWGNISERQLLKAPEESEVLEALSKQTGAFLQRPPDVSAVKVEGERAYRIAKSGGKVAIKPKRVSVYDLRLHEYEFPTLELTITCSSGTYIRSIARDLGEELGTGALMSSLVRTNVGPFDLARAIGVEDVELERLPDVMQDVSAAFDCQDSFVLSDEQIQLLYNGRPIIVDRSDQRLLARFPGGQFAACLRRSGELYRAEVNWVPWMVEEMTT